MTFDFEREALIASGIGEEDRIRESLRDLDEILSRFEQDCLRGGELVIASADLFMWLWRKRPNRYRAGAPFRLHEVMDGQMSESREPVGNCLGLTLLYNCLLRRRGINARAVYLESVFGTDPHVLSVLDTPAGPIDVEHVFPHGYGYQGHIKDPSRRNLGKRELVAEIYNSEGNECFRRGKLDAALKNYERAVRMDPGHERASLNILITVDKRTVEDGERRK